MSERLILKANTGQVWGGRFAARQLAPVKNPTKQAASSIWLKHTGKKKLFLIVDLPVSNDCRNSSVILLVPLPDFLG